MGAQIILNYWSLHMCSLSSQIIGWVRLVMIKLSNGQEAFYLKGIGWKKTSMMLNPW